MKDRREGFQRMVLGLDRIIWGGGLTDVGERLDSEQASRLCLLDGWWIWVGRWAQRFIAACLLVVARLLGMGLITRGFDALLC